MTPLGLGVRPNTALGVSCWAPFVSLTRSELGSIKLSGVVVGEKRRGGSILQPDSPGLLMMKKEFLEELHLEVIQEPLPLKHREFSEKKRSF